MLTSITCEFLTPCLWKTFWVICIQENKQLCVFAEKNIAFAADGCRDMLICESFRQTELLFEIRWPLIDKEWYYWSNKGALVSSVFSFLWLIWMNLCHQLFFIIWAKDQREQCGQCFDRSRNSGLGGFHLLPPANEVSGKVMYLHVSVCPRGRGLIERPPGQRPPGQRPP